MSEPSSGQNQEGKPIPPQRISSEITFPLPFVLTIATAVAGFMVWVVSLLSQLDTRFDAVERQINDLTYFSTDRWRGVDMELYTTKLQQLNPDIRVPDIQAILRRNR